MAGSFFSLPKFSSFIILVMISLSFLPSTLSHESQILNVTTSIQNTLHVLSPKFHQELISFTPHFSPPASSSSSPKFHRELISFTPHFSPPASSSSSSSSLSLSLHPRSSLTKPQHTNYTSLTLARHARDMARVSQLEQLRHSTPVTSRGKQGSGEYFVRLGFGQPVKELYMAIDTASDITWLQCQPCSACYNQTDPIFTPDNSSTYNRVSCDSPACSALHESACSAGSCTYQVTYGDGSFSSGELATETLSFKEGSFSNVAIGCGHDNGGLFIGSAGLIALGRGSLSLPSQIKASSFSYCLVDRDSNSLSTLDFSSVGPNDSILALLLRNSKRYGLFYVGLTGISVASEMLSVPETIFQVDDDGNGGIIVDSGTAVTRLQRSVHNALRDTFVKYAQDLPYAGKFSVFDACFDLSSMTMASVPTVAFHFSGDKMLSLHPKNTLVPVDSSGKFCLAFAPTDGSLMMIGNIQQQGTRVSYDLANNLVGFNPDKC